MKTFWEIFSDKWEYLKPTCIYYFEMPLKIEGFTLKTAIKNCIKNSKLCILQKQN